MFRSSERGSALMLMPAAVLVMLMLSAIAVDSAVVFLAHRRLTAITSAAANDLAVTALPSQANTGQLTPSNEEVSSQLGAVISRQTSNGLSNLRCHAAASASRVTVGCEATIHYIFASAIPGARHATVVRAQTTSTPIRRRPTL